MATKRKARPDTSVEDDLENAGRFASLKNEVKGKVEKKTKDVTSWTDEHRPHMPMLDLGFRFFERDRDCDAAIIGSAVALRVFLFFVPLMLVVVGAAGFLSQWFSGKDTADQLGVKGGLATQIDSALKQGATARWVALLTGLFGAAWAGRTLAKTLVVASRRAWQIPPPPKQYALRVFGCVAGLIAAVGLLTIATNRVRDAVGVGIGTTMVIGCAFASAIAWFFVSLVLPRAPSDPSALLPGAVVVGAVLGFMEWFVQFYLPNRISNASQLYGAIGITIVTLGWFFIIGRLFVMSFVLNAVVFERFGSLSEFVFGMPGVRRIPKRWPRVAAFFGLDRNESASDQSKELLE
jgi:uncharacterized BrkB/YihY/UPF0761 family membrane protein